MSDMSVVCLSVRVYMCVCPSVGLRSRRDFYLAYNIVLWYLKHTQCPRVNCVCATDYICIETFIYINKSIIRLFVGELRVNYALKS